MEDMNTKKQAETAAAAPGSGKEGAAPVSMGATGAMSSSSAAMIRATWANTMITVKAIRALPISRKQ